MPAMQRAPKPSPPPPEPHHVYERAKNQWIKPAPVHHQPTFRDHMMSGYGVAKRLGSAARTAFEVGQVAWQLASEAAPYLAPLAAFL